MTAKGWAGLALAGLAFGVLTSALDHAGSGPVGAIAAIVGGGPVWACVLIGAAWWATRDDARAVSSGEVGSGSTGTLWLRGMTASVLVALTAVVGYFLGDLVDSPVEAVWWAVGALITGIPLGWVGVAAHGRRVVGLLARLVGPTGLFVWGWIMLQDERSHHPDPWRVTAFGLAAVVGLSLVAWFVISAVDRRGMPGRRDDLAQG